MDDARKPGINTPDSSVRPSDRLERIAVRSVAWRKFVLEPGIYSVQAPWLEPGTDGREGGGWRRGKDGG